MKSQYDHTRMKLRPRCPGCQRLGPFVFTIDQTFPLLQPQMSWDALRTEIRFKLLEAAAQEHVDYQNQATTAPASPSTRPPSIPSNVGLPRTNDGWPHKGLIRSCRRWLDNALVRTCFPLCSLCPKAYHENVSIDIKGRASNGFLYLLRLEPL